VCGAAALIACGNCCTLSPPAAALTDGLSLAVLIADREGQVHVVNPLLLWQAGKEQGQRTGAMHAVGGSSSGVCAALQLTLRSWIACLMGDVLLKSGMGGGAESPACFATVAILLLSDDLVSVGCCLAPREAHAGRR
jgi:hypothetical protein